MLFMVQRVRRLGGVRCATVYNTRDDGRKLRPKHVEL